MRILSLLTIVLMMGCAVEAGNPVVDGGKKTGSATLLLSGVSERFNSMLKFDIDSILMSGYDGDQAFVTEVELINSAITLDESSGEEAITVATAEELPSGVYDQVVFGLVEDAPIVYHIDDNEEQEVYLPEQEEAAFSFAIDLYLEEDLDHEVIISMDIDGSIDRKNSNRKLFRPRGHALPKRRGKTYKGETEQLADGVVCAYAYAPVRPKHPTGVEFKEKRPPPPRPLPKGFKAPKKKGFETKEAIEFDDELPCANAFQRARLVDGGYTLRSLMPASYVVRAFDADGTIYELGDIEIEPPEGDIARWTRALSTPMLKRSRLESSL